MVQGILDCLVPGCKRRGPPRQVTSIPLPEPGLRPRLPKLRARVRFLPGALAAAPKSLKLKLRSSEGLRETLVFVAPEVRYSLPCRYGDREESSGERSWVGRPERSAGQLPAESAPVARRPRRRGPLLRGLRRHRGSHDSRYRTGRDHRADWPDWPDWHDRRIRCRFEPGARPESESGSRSDPGARWNGRRARRDGRPQHRPLRWWWRSAGSKRRSN